MATIGHDKMMLKNTLMEKTMCTLCAQNNNECSRYQVINCSIYFLNNPRLVIRNVVPRKENI